MKSVERPFGRMVIPFLDGQHQRVTLHLQPVIGQRGIGKLHDLLVICPFDEFRVGKADRRLGSPRTTGQGVELRVDQHARKSVGVPAQAASFSDRRRWRKASTSASSDRKPVTLLRNSLSTCCSISSTRASDM